VALCYRDNEGYCDNKTREKNDDIFLIVTQIGDKWYLSLSDMPFFSSYKEEKLELGFINFECYSNLF